MCVSAFVSDDAAAATSAPATAGVVMTTNTKTTHSQRIAHLYTDLRANADSNSTAMCLSKRTRMQASADTRNT